MKTGLNRLLAWWRARTPQERWMIALIAVLLVGVIVRRTWISSEVSDALRQRFSSPE